MLAYFPIPTVLQLQGEAYTDPLGTVWMTRPAQCPEGRPLVILRRNRKTHAEIPGFDSDRAIARIIREDVRASVEAEEIFDPDWAPARTLYGLWKSPPEGYRLEVTDFSWVLFRGNRRLVEVANRPGAADAVIACLPSGERG